ncbi:hypothetical protein CTI12_AA455700 [Artemisia annua]|uniref:Uncharacterized protein n=1 Tax=Artemisia annua TaxID=35608 RepID=A0A2U1LSN1_ARTAN|nr:hypothetical protein CTI12_AA455700 [Artemisia annua]
MSSTIDKIQISGPTLASLLHRFTTSSGDIDGLLFGHVTTTTPLTLSDTTITTPTTTITITSFFSSPSTTTFYTPSGHLHTPTITTLTTNQPPLIGWFSGRRKTHLRPSMKETNVTSNLARYLQNDQSCIFLLLTTPFYENLIHTHDYKVFSFSNGSGVFEVKGLDILNLGPGFRGHYGHFEPMSLFPDIGFSVKGLDIETMVEDGGDEGGDKKFGELCDESGFDVGRLKRLLGEEASGYTAELEEMYNNMIKKMNALAKVVEQSSAKVLQQENHNMKLRYKVAGLE